MACSWLQKRSSSHSWQVSFQCCLVPSSTSQTFLESPKCSKAPWIDKKITRLVKRRKLIGKQNKDKLSKIDQSLPVKKIGCPSLVVARHLALRKTRLTSRRSNQWTGLDLLRGKKSKKRQTHQQAKRRKQQRPEMKRRRCHRVLVRRLQLQAQPLRMIKRMMMNIQMTEKHFRKRTDRVQPELRKLQLAVLKNEIQAVVCSKNENYIMILYLQTHVNVYVYTSEIRIK